MLGSVITNIQDGPQWSLPLILPHMKKTYLGNHQGGMEMTMMTFEDKS